MAFQRIYISSGCTVRRVGGVIVFDNLLEKLKYEFDKYLAYMHLVSRSDFMTRAYEISCKKAIYDRLINAYEKKSFVQHELEMMMNQDDLIDYIYMIGKKHIVLCNECITEESWLYIRQAIKY